MSSLLYKPSMTFRKRLFYLYVFNILLSGCATKVAQHLARIGEITEGNTEIELEVKETSYGGPSIPLPIPFTYRSSSWIYVARTNGVVSAKDIIFSYAKFGSPFYQPIRNLEGDVSFEFEALTLTLRLPVYKAGTEEVDKHISYWRNGRYLWVDEMKIK